MCSSWVTVQCSASFCMDVWETAGLQTEKAKRAEQPHAQILAQISATFEYSG